MEHDLEKVRARLLELREELLRIGESAEEGRRPVELDQSRVGRLSRMDALQVQAMAVEADRRRAVELKRIDAALARIEAGEYGYCANCDEEIAAKRLEFDPAVPTCIDCARGA
jgi:DnaK suppressor protein